MKMRISMNSFCMFAGVMLLTSCSELRSPHYVGEPVMMDEDDPPKESIWMQGESVYYVRRTGSNTLVAATLEWNKKNGDYTVKSFPMVLTELDDHIFLNVKKGDDYTILRLACACDESFMLFTVDSEMMKKAIADGTVKAHTDDDHIIMDGTKEEQDEFIAKNINTMFSMDCGSLARRLSKDDPDKKEKKQKKNARKPIPVSSDVQKTEV